MKEVKNLNTVRECFKFVLRWEVGSAPNGGYTNDPNDPGGETKYGISKRAHPNEDIKNMTPERALEIYIDEYWHPSGAENLEWPLNLIVFDTAILCGVARVKEWLPKADVPEDFLGIRREFHIRKARENKWARKYIAGWLNRVHALELIIAEHINKV